MCNMAHLPWMQGSDIDVVVSSLLADCAWGRLEPGPVWIPVGRLATDRYPSHSSEQATPLVMDVSRPQA